MIASPMLWLAALACVIGGTVCDVEHRPWRVSSLAIAVWSYAAWGIANSFINQAYTAAGLFNPLFLVGGFAAGRSASTAVRERLLPVLLAGAVVLAACGVLQSATGEGRAHAHFETPNTLATVLNLMLAPSLFAMAYGKERRCAMPLGIVLTAGLVATLSRGGLISLGAALLATMLLFGARPRRSGALRLCAVLVSGALIGVLALSAPRWSGMGGPFAQVQITDIAETAAGSASSRGELYRLAFSNLGAHPWLGTGYLGFRALLEAHRADVPSYASENITYFVHNDYLQTLMELGLPGAAVLIAIVALPFWLGKRSDIPADDRRSVFTALSGIAAMAIHALGDFPFYVPICLFLFGVLVGQADARLPWLRCTFSPSRGLRVARAAVVAVLGIIMVLPPLAEAAAAYGDRRWRSGNSQSAAFALELARRLQPRDWRYHWYAGQFWYAQASAGNARAATLADRAFAAAIEANGREPRPLLARLATQMRFAASLDEPQSVATLRDWADQALALAPLNPGVRRDYAAALERLSPVR